MNLYTIFQQHPEVTTDSRNCPKDSLFFALKGDKFNANAFAATALENGCAYAIVDEVEYAVDERYIVVDDVLSSLQDLAKQHREHLGTKIIGITGTNGKTTTKELIASVLKEKYNILYTQGNLNNHIGVPLTLLQLKPEHQLAIIEMGANHIGEIAMLCDMAQPNFGLITNVGKAHLEGFGSFEGVMQTKAELYNYIASKGLGVFINIDNTYLKEMVQSAQINEDKLVSYSINLHPDVFLVTGKVVESRPYLTMNCQTGDEFDVQSQLIGAYNAENILAAVTIGHFFGLTNAQIKHGLEAYVPTNNRSQYIETKDNHLIVDAYNANPSSMQIAINNFAQTSNVQKMLILGDMLELGAASLAEHQVIVDMLIDKGLYNTFLVGKEFQHTKNDFLKFDKVDDLVEYLSSHKITDQTILIKGSRGIQLEKVLSKL